MMTVAAAQADIRLTYVDGGPGAVISAAVWLGSAYVLTQFGTVAAFIALFLGGMLIFPLSALVCRYVFVRAPLKPDNPLALVALESTIAMIGCLFAAWLLLPTRLDAAFPIAAIAVGTHYFAFKTAYGDRTFWALAAVITLIGIAGIFWLPGNSLAVVLAVAVAELGFGIILTRRSTAWFTTAT